MIGFFIHIKPVARRLIEPNKFRWFFYNVQFHLLSNIDA